MLEQIFFGTYTKRTSQGIYQAVLDTSQGQCSEPKLLTKIANPTYLQLSAEQQLFSVVQQANQGGIAQFSLQTPSVPLIAKDLAFGAPPCYIGLDPQRHLVFTANYHTAMVKVFRASATEPLKLLAQKKFTGHGPRPEQEAAHIHYADLTPDQRLAVCDLGADRVYTYSVTADGQLLNEQILQLPAGFGPRHLVFHPTAQIAFLVGELSSQIAALQYDPATGKFKLLQQLATIPSNWQQHNGAAAVKISVDGKFVYVSNRGHDSLAVFAWKKQQLELQQLISTEGKFPRDFEIDPTGQFLLAANQNSNNATLFERSVLNGELICRQKDLPLPEGVCVKFAIKN
ncbi:lactonase family protein [Liquorilactobacillus sicerae]|uniref:lactonase family protein n=1 Tax=Liquorilactobacillus sicerae TaxID=1416943 RepID=UPI002480EF65|nr:lactonase family protein [Liquorilactobacillus sicerae]